MSFVREYGLVHNPGTSERFVRLVRWEVRWRPVTIGAGNTDDTYEAAYAVPVQWEWTPLDVSNPRKLEFSGPTWAMVPTRITELPMRRLAPPMWPREAPTESESARRERIRVLRRACHVDPVKGEAEPRWVVPRGDRAKIGNVWMAPPETGASSARAAA